MKIYCFEGLFSYSAGWLTRSLEAQGLKVEKYGWTEKPEIEDGSIICGHSYGGYRAIERANQSKALMLFTLDPRKPLSMNPDFQVKMKAYNYYQTGFVRGYEVAGAFNTRITGLSHLSMPKSTLFIKDILQFTRG